MSDRQYLPIPDERLRDALTRLPDDESISADLASIVATIAGTSQNRGRLVGAIRMWTPAVRVAFLVLLLVSLAIAIGFFVGSQRRLPPPFGLARPGLIAFDLSDGIYVANADGGGRTKLTSGPARDTLATFSPDGTLIAYLSGGQPDLSSALVVVGADGRHPTVLAEHLAEPGDISWSPDSRRVAIGSRLIGSLPNTFHIYVADVDRPGAVQLGGPNLYGQDPSWSPDGTKIAFKREFPCCGGPPDGLWLMNADGTDASRLSNTRGDPYNTFANTAWSPDGTRLAFLADGVGSAYDVFVVNVDASGERNISNSPENEFWASWSPDGKRIAFTRMIENPWTAGELIVTDPEGSNPIVLKGANVNSNTPVWSPDGKRVLAYAKNPDPGIDANADLAIFDPSTGRPPILLSAQGFTSATWQRLAP